MRAASKFRSQKLGNSCGCQLGEVCWHVKVIHMLKNVYSHTCSQGSRSSNSRVKCHIHHNFGHTSFQCQEKSVSMLEKDSPKRSQNAIKEYEQLLIKAEYLIWETVPFNRILGPAPNLRELSSFWRGRIDGTTISGLKKKIPLWKPKVKENSQPGKCHKMIFLKSLTSTYDTIINHLPPIHKNIPPTTHAHL